MNNFGFIHEDLDIQILILYVLDKLPGPVKPYTLSDLCLFDGGFTWFDYSQCLAKLIRTGHVTDENGLYEITEKGRRNVTAVATSLPFSVRAKADKLTAPVAASMRREQLIETDCQPADAEGGQTVTLRMSDGVGEVIDLRLAVPNEALAEIIQTNFRSDAELLYNQIILLLTGEKIP